MSRLSASISQPCLSSISLQSTPDGPTQIFPFMYLGSQQDALDTEQMRVCLCDSLNCYAVRPQSQGISQRISPFFQKRGITHVVNLSIGCPRASAITSDENFLRIPVNDSYQEKLSPHFETAWEFLEGVRRSGNVVLIHCLAGISRSPTLAISYVMRYKNMSSEDAYRLVKEKRPSISPNFNFMGQLLEYEQLLIKKGLLSAEASSKRVDRPLSLKQEFDSEDADTTSGPATKVPKSASTHCVFFDRPRDFSTTVTARVNEHGKRGLNDSLDRPKVLGLYNADTKRHVAEELPSPSTELSKLTFAGGLPSPSSPVAEHANLSLSNPCFVSPTRETLHPEAASSHTEECETSRRSYFKHRIDADTNSGPATKVPKSASTHCVFFDRPRDFSTTVTARVNEHGKRGLNDSLDRPKVLGLYNADTKRHVAEELPSPSTELSKLTFAGGLPSPSSPVAEHANLSLSNPCFVSPTRETLHPEAASSHTEECETSRRSYFKHRIVSLFKVRLGYLITR
ncbi:dual specificity phosphatase, catalytic domain protein [Ancylostoma ceylanicum]|uniref:protein-tyrosine-phosphatase n=1 Tax=Ancylostoma ceylanicum TaxID=53326 RepID=A0A0D6L9P2_9BILA|nr:dual specificity phosphatase, catalytic domain protein [Ancylostoma ceylanicum]